MGIYQVFKLEGKKIEKQKGEHIFLQGEIDKSLYLLKSGLLKAYYTSESGKEFIKSFFLPNDIVCSLTSAYSERDCSFSLVCLEPSSLVKIPSTILQEHSSRDPEIASSMIDLLLEFAMKKEKREYEFLCLSAEERFLKMIKTTPSLINKVTQNDIARYLGVTPVGLSRIKSRTLKKLKG